MLARKAALLELCRASIRRGPAISKATGHDQCAGKVRPSADLRKEESGRLA
jgi:hypothetical protein